MNLHWIIMQTLMKEKPGGANIPHKTSDQKPEYAFKYMK